MLKTAEVDASLDLVSRIALLAKLRSTLRIVRRFEARVEHAILASQIKARAVELESAMRGLQANGEFATERRTR